MFFKTRKRDEQQKLDGTKHSKDSNNDIDEMPKGVLGQPDTKRWVP